MLAVVVPQSRSAQRLELVVLEHSLSDDTRTLHMLLSVLVCSRYRTLKVHRLELASAMPLSTTVSALQFIKSTHVVLCP